MDELLEKLKMVFKGQIYIIMAMCVIYSLGLLACGLGWFALLGIFSGILGVVPYLGIISGIVIGIIAVSVGTLVGVLHFHILLYIVLLYLSAEIINVYLLTPKIMEKQTGLNPWVIFGSTIVCGLLFGVIGMIFAVPIAIVFFAIVKIINAHISDNR